MSSCLQVISPATSNQQWRALLHVFVRCRWHCAVWYCWPSPWNQMERLLHTATPEACPVRFPALMGRQKTSWWSLQTPCSFCAAQMTPRSEVPASGIVRKSPRCCAAYLPSTKCPLGAWAKLRWAPSISVCRTLLGELVACQVTPTPRHWWEQPAVVFCPTAWSTWNSVTTLSRESCLTTTDVRAWNPTDIENKGSSRSAIGHSWTMVSKSIGLFLLLFVFDPHVPPHSSHLLTLPVDKIVVKFFSTLVPCLQCLLKFHTPFRPMWFPKFYLDQSNIFSWVYTESYTLSSHRSVLTLKLAPPVHTTRY